MKTILFALLLFVGLSTYAQKDNVKLEKHQDLYSVTLYHENGEISQKGFITADKKLHGTWKSYDSKGQKTSMGHYENGNKTGRWLFWSNLSQELTQVDYGANNSIANVYAWQSSSQLTTNNL